MCELGNGVINQIYEARREELGARKPNPGDPRYIFKFSKTEKQMLFFLPQVFLHFISSLAFSVFHSS